MVLTPLTIAKRRRLSRVHLLVLTSYFALSSSALSARDFPNELFGYGQRAQTDALNISPLAQALRRPRITPASEDICGTEVENECRTKQWLKMLKRARELPRDQQLRTVNEFINAMPYVADIDNYNAEDYWATPGELFENGGDCEDYAIAKLLSLRWLDFQPDSLRVVVLQDTEIGRPHAVLAVAHDDDVLILDNQTKGIMSHRQIAHYTPVYSVNETRWWFHSNDEQDPTEGFVQVPPMTGSLNSTEGR